MASSCCPLQVTLPESHWFWWEEGWAPSLPENCTRAPGLQLHQEAGKLCLPFPAALALPEENQVSPTGREMELAARGQRLFGYEEGTCGKRTCPASSRRLPRASDLLPRPSQGCSGIHTNQGGGGEPGSLQAPSSPFPSQAVLRAQHGPGPQPLHSPHQGLSLHTSDGTKGLLRAKPWQSPSYGEGSGADDDPLVVRTTTSTLVTIKLMLTLGLAHSSSLNQLDQPILLDETEVPDD